MAKKIGFESFEFFVLLIFLFSFTTIVNAQGSPPRIFDVTRYGAVGDGRRDNSQAFLRAWKDGCAFPGRSRIVVPGGRYLLRSVTFEGYCRGNMSMIIRGTLVAPTDPQSFFTDSWIRFLYVNYLTVKGGGYLDGQGAAAWPYNDCSRNSQCRQLPASLRFDFVNHSTIQNIRSINAKNAHMTLFASNYVTISKVRLTAPDDSPNTDGIKMGKSTNINITSVRIGTGDDCIAMVAGSQDIDINDVTCGPGHGISIGSLGKSHEKEYVRGIRVRNSTFIRTDNGVRIKTWAPSLQSLASDITFQDINMQNVMNPILIDQQYCPYINCKPQQANSGVQIRDVTFNNIWGESTSEVAVKMVCSGAFPCQNVRLNNIDLSYNGRGQAKSVCSNVNGHASGKQIPGGCL